MLFSCKSAVEYDLMLHYQLRDVYTKELQKRSMYKGCRLKPNKKRKNRAYYSVKYPQDSDYSYIGNDLQEDVNGIKEYAYFSKALEVIDKNIQILEEFLTIYQKTSAEHINELLTFPYSLPLDSQILKQEKKIEDWLHSRAKEKMQEPPYEPAGLKVTAFDGTPMRSRAEAIHYEAFYIYGIPAFFECPLKIDGETFHPDFALLDLYTMSTFLMEHLGHWFHENEYKRKRYREDANHRIDSYTKVGYFPESNLLLTFGADDNIFDVQNLHRKIAMLAVPPPSEETMNLLKRC